MSFCPYSFLAFRASDVTVSVLTPIKPFSYFKMLNLDYILVPNKQHQNKPEVDQHSSYQAALVGLIGSTWI